MMTMRRRLVRTWRRPLAVLANSPRALVEREQATLRRVSERLVESDASESDIRLLSQLVKQLDELFMLVVVGEFNSGKSSFINTLLGNDYLAEGITPTTSQINIVRHNDTITREVDSEQDLVRIGVPSEWLRDIRLVDTPGTNAVIRAHERITTDFIPRSDLVLFVTSSDRAFSESERKFLELIHEWRKKVVVVLSKIDLVESSDDLEQLTTFVREQMKAHLDLDPTIFPVSAKIARRGNEKDSGFVELRRFVMETLDETERLRLKLRSPIGVARRTLDRLDSALEHRQEALAVDTSTLEGIDKRLLNYKKRILERELDAQLATIDSALLRLGSDAQRFIDNELTFSNSLALIDARKVEKRFTKRVAEPAAKATDRGVERLSDWLLERAASEWSAVVDGARVAVAQRKNSPPPPIEGHFEFKRETLLENLHESAHKTLAFYHGDGARKEDEHGSDGSKQLAESLRSAVLATISVELGVAGFASAFSASLFDVTMVLPLSAVAIGGLVLLPLRRAQLKSQMHGQTEKLREEMRGALLARCTARVDTNIQNINKVLADYRLFVEKEKQALNDAKKRINDSHKDLDEMEEEIDEVLK